MPKNVQKCKNWFKEIANWTSEDWKRIIWNNELPLELGLSSCKIMIFTHEVNAINKNDLQDPI